MAISKPIKTCQRCSAAFQSSPSKNRVFCSRECYAATIRKDPVSRFWKRVDRKGPDECWPWTAARTLKRGGYGAIGIGRRVVLAHRFSWQIHNGPIRGGLFVCHHCDNPPCVNPKHLFLGDAKDNAVDKVSKGRQSRRTGDDSPRAKLTAWQVIEIRQDPRLHRVIAEQYGISAGHVGCVKSLKAWAHLQ